jgi:hypothetical protein
MKIVSCLAGMDEYTIRNQSHMALHLNGLDSRYQLNIKIPSSGNNNRFFVKLF